MIARLALLFTLLLIGCGRTREVHPGDAQLLERFHAHRAELEQVVSMFQEDEGLGRVGSTFTRPDDPSRVGVTSQRLAEYRRLCGAVEAPDCIEGYSAAYDRLFGVVQPGQPQEKDPIWIHVSSIGLAVTGSGKGFAYSLRPEFPIVSDLDHISARRSGTWLRHIEGPWYLYFEYED